MKATQQSLLLVPPLCVGVECFACHHSFVKWLSGIVVVVVFSGKAVPVRCPITMSSVAYCPNAKQHFPPLTQTSLQTQARHGWRATAAALYCCYSCCSTGDTTRPVLAATIELQDLPLRLRPVQPRASPCCVPLRSFVRVRSSRRSSDAKEETKHAGEVEHLHRSTRGWCVNDVFIRLVCSAHLRRATSKTRESSD